MKEDNEPLVRFRRFGSAVTHSQVHVGSVPQLQTSDRAEHRARKATHKPRYVGHAKRPHD